MAVRYIRMSELASEREKPGRWPVSRNTIFRWIKSGKMPPPTKLGGHLNSWEEHQIEAVEAAGTVAKKAGVPA